MICASRQSSGQSFGASRANGAIAQNWLIGSPVLPIPKSRAGEVQLGRGARCSDKSLMQRASTHSSAIRLFVQSGLTGSAGERDGNLLG
jgi:hypothetical protein